jgi:hypothetical protein
MIYLARDGLLIRVGMPRQTNDQVIEFTPKSGFAIEKLAETIVKAMREMDMDAQVNLPGNIVLEIEKDCTEGEIVEGYNDYMSTHVKSRPASNANDKESQ